jgi:rhodanese-related sulfurtransferase
MEGATRSTLYRKDNDTVKDLAMTSFANQPNEINLPDQPDVMDLPGQPDVIDLPGQPDEIDLPTEPDKIELPDQPDKIALRGQPAEANLAEQVEAVKSRMTAPLPTPPQMSSKQASASELLARLKWGEPALTIIDARSREAFNNERITGAVLIPVGPDAAAIEPMLEYSRDIYIYSDRPESTAEAANQLRQAGFRNVAELQGGLAGWKQIDGPTEGIYAFSSPVGRE